MKTMDTNLFIRALAIMSVVFNHAYIDRYFREYGTTENIFFGLSLAGGANVLLFLSGYNFAEFILNKPDVSSLKISIVNFAKKIFIPSLFLIVFYFLILFDFNIYELLFVRNFVDGERISKFPTWYPQVMLQILLVLYFVLPLIFKKMKGNSWVVSLVFFMVSVLFSLIYVYVYKISMSDYKVPQLYSWVFILGWVFYYAKLSDDLSKKVIAYTLLFLSCLLIIGPFDLNFYWLCFASALLLFSRTVIVNSFIKKLLTLVAQATFIIFLFHRFFFKVLEKLAPFSYGYITLFIFSVGATLMLWAIGSSFSRVCAKHLRKIG